MGVFSSLWFVPLEKCNIYVYKYYNPIYQSIYQFGACLFFAVHYSSRCSVYKGRLEVLLTDEANFKVFGSHRRKDAGGVMMVEEMW